MPMAKKSGLDFGTNWKLENVEAKLSNRSSECSKWTLKQSR